MSDHEHEFRLGSLDNIGQPVIVGEDVYAADKYTCACGAVEFRSYGREPICKLASYPPHARLRPVTPPTRTFTVYTGDGNDGTSFDHVIDAIDMDDAVRQYMDGVSPEKRDLFDEDGDDRVAYLTVYEDTDGSRAYNGGAYFIAEIWDGER